MQSQKCLQCGLVNFSGAQNCKRCNSDLTSPFVENKPKQARLRQPQKISTDCPRCASSDTQSYGMAYRTGTSSGRVSALSYNGNVGFIGTGGTVTNQTVLASQVRPPSDPDSVVHFLIVLFLSGIILIVTSIFFYEVFGIIGFPLGFFLTAGFVFCLYKFTGPTRKKNKLNYERHLAKWSRSWVCLRCGTDWMI